METQTDHEGHQALGRMLAALRNAAGHTQETFAPLTGYSRSTVANVETGRQRVPREFWIRGDEVLASGAQLVTAYDRITADRAARQRQGAAAAFDLLRPSGQHARMSPTSSLAPDHDRMADVPSMGDAAADVSVSQAALASAGLAEDSITALFRQVSSIARGYATADRIDAFGRAGALRDTAAALAGCTRRPRDLVDVYLVAALANALMASAVFDLAQPRAAMALTRTARTYADLAGHPSLIAWADGLLAIICNWAGRPDSALKYVERGLSARPAVAGQFRLCHIAARSHGLRGDAASVDAALAGAQRHRPAASVAGDLMHDEIGGEFRFDEARAHACAGAAWLSVADGPRAAVHLEQAIAAYRPVGNHAALPAPALGARIDLAAAKLLAGNLDAASECVSYVLGQRSAPRISVLGARLAAMRSRVMSDRRFGSAGADLGERIQSWVADAPQLPAVEVSAGG